MLEMVVSTILLSTLALVLAPCLQAVNRQRTATRFSVLAQIELSNVAVRLHSSTGNTQRPPTLSAWFTDRYTDAKLEVSPIQAQPPTDEQTPDSSSNDHLNPVRIRIARPRSENLPDESESVVVWLPHQDTPQPEESE
jgi:type II secretory pathway pseudopilin PulG